MKKYITYALCGIFLFFSTILIMKVLLELPKESYEEWRQILQKTAVELCERKRNYMVRVVTCSTVTRSPTGFDPNLKIWRCGCYYVDEEFDSVRIFEADVHNWFKQKNVIESNRRKRWEE